MPSSPLDLRGGRATLPRATAAMNMTPMIDALLVLSTPPSARGDARGRHHGKHAPLAGWRRLRPVRHAWLLALVLASACAPPAPPPVAPRQQGLEADDVAVMKALFDDLLRPGRVPGARLLVVDRTMAVCRRDPDPFGSRVGRCVREEQIELASKVLPAPTARALALNFPRWNAAPLSIAAPLGDDVVYVSPTLVDTLAPGELLRRYPAGSDVVMLTAPAYPAPRIAVIIFSTAGGLGAARLERQSDARWRVAARVSHDVD